MTQSIINQYQAKINQECSQINPLKQLHQKEVRQLVGAVLVYRQKQTINIVGTGFLISKNLVLTAAHNIHPQNRISKIQFYPGFHGAKTECYEIDIKWVKIPQKYRDNMQKGAQKAQSDYALLRLKSDIKCKYFYPLKICHDEEKTLKDILISLNGYPIQNVDKNMEIRQNQSKKSNVIQKFEGSKSLFHHTLSTRGGMSGSPFIIKLSDQVQDYQNNEIQHLNYQQAVIGLHNGYQGKKNIGIWITKQLIFQLQEWRRQSKGSPFKVIYGPIILNSDAYCYKIEDRQNEKINELSLKKNQTLKQQNKKLESQNSTLKCQINKKQKIISQSANEINRLKKKQKQLYFITGLLIFFIFAGCCYSFGKQNNQQMLYLSQQKQNEQNTNSSQNLTVLNTIQSKQNSIEGNNNQMKNTMPVNIMQNQQNSIEENIRMPIYNKSFWDRKSYYEQNFIIEDNIVIRNEKGDGNYFQMISISPLSLTSSSIIRFKVAKYGGENSICFGIITTSRLRQRWSGYQGDSHQSVGYWSNPQNQIGRMNINGKVKTDWKKQLFVPEGQIIEMTVNIPHRLIAFKNSKREVRHELDRLFVGIEIYAFVAIRDYKTAVEIV